MAAVTAAHTKSILICFAVPVRVHSQFLTGIKEFIHSFRIINSGLLEHWLAAIQIHYNGGPGIQVQLIQSCPHLLQHKVIHFICILPSLKHVFHIHQTAHSIQFRSPHWFTDKHIWSCSRAYGRYELIMETRWRYGFKIHLNPISCIGLPLIFKHVLYCPLLVFPIPVCQLYGFLCSLRFTLNIFIRYCFCRLFSCLVRSSRAASAGTPCQGNEHWYT